LLTLGLISAFLFTLQCGAQNAPGSQRGGMLPQPIGQPVGDNGDISNGNPNQIQNERLLRTLNADRQKSLVSDANKLLRLANELNAEVGRTSPEEFTPSQLHKLAARPRFNPPFNRYTIEGAKAFNRRHKEGRAA
jgi:hypothetical protein